MKTKNTYLMLTIFEFAIMDDFTLNGINCKFIEKFANAK